MEEKDWELLKSCYRERLYSYKLLLESYTELSGPIRIPSAVFIVLEEKLKKLVNQRKCASIAEDRKLRRFQEGALRVLIQNNSPQGPDSEHLKLLFFWYMLWCEISRV